MQMYWTVLEYNIIKWNYLYQYLWHLKPEYVKPQEVCYRLCNPVVTRL